MEIPLVDLRKQYQSGHLARKNATVTVSTFYYKAEPTEEATE